MLRGRVKALDAATNPSSKFAVLRMTGEIRDAPFLVSCTPIDFKREGNGRALLARTPSQRTAAGRCTSVTVAESNENSLCISSRRRSGAVSLTDWSVSTTSTGRQSARASPPERHCSPRHLHEYESAHPNLPLWLQVQPVVHPRRRSRQQAFPSVEAVCSAGSAPAAIRDTRPPKKRWVDRRQRTLARPPVHRRLGSRVRTCASDRPGFPSQARMRVALLASTLDERAVETSQSVGRTLISVHHSVSQRPMPHRVSRPMLVSM